MRPREPGGGTRTGLITIVQEDRFRLVDDAGRGYLFIAGRGTVEGETLEAWREGRRRVRVRYRGVPDMGAVTEEVSPL